MVSPLGSGVTLESVMIETYRLVLLNRETQVVPTRQTSLIPTESETHWQRVIGMKLYDFPISIT